VDSYGLQGVDTKKSLSTNGVECYRNVAEDSKESEG
jgi:hypothetical protein